MDIAKAVASCTKDPAGCAEDISNTASSLAKASAELLEATVARAALELMQRAAAGLKAPRSPGAPSCTLRKRSRGGSGCSTVT